MQRKYAVFCLFTLMTIQKSKANLPPVFTQVMNNIVLSEATTVGKVIYKLEGYDPEGSEVVFGVAGTDNFDVDPKSGDITLIKSLDREEKDSLSFLVSIKDRVNVSGDSEDDNLVAVPVNVIVLDENDNKPVFSNVVYEAEVREDADVGLTIFDKILVTDKDMVGEILNISCVSKVPEICSSFELKVLESSQNFLAAAVVLNTTLDYNLRMIYPFHLAATDGKYTSMQNFEVRVKDVQNTPPVFLGSLSAVIQEDSPIGTLVLKIQARDGDNGEPRKIVYDLLTNPMDYFLLDPISGELRTAKPLDREVLPDTTGLVTLSICARELISGIPGMDNLTSSTTSVSITIKDVNDSPPTFNRKEYAVSLIENTTAGTPLALEMDVTDKDVGVNSIFSLRLEDISGAFEVDPHLVKGFSQVNIRVANESLDYENPNQRKFILLVVAEETETNPKLSSTATVTVSVIDANDNKPVFDQDTYSAVISESAKPGQFITSITAKDIDSGNYGDAGVRYTLSGAGAELFSVNSKTGVITLADCNANINKKNVNLEYQEGSATKISTKNSETMPSITNNEAEIESNSNYFTDLITYDERNASFANIIHESCLDYETQKAYFLSYKATDDNGKGQTSVVSLKISVTDSNDNPPICENDSYRSSVEEGATFIDPPLMVKATDIDTISDISYRIIEDESLGNWFEIDRRSGQITIKTNSSLDVNYLKSDTIHFDVEASDGLYSTMCKVNITIRDVNNHAPTFLKTSYESFIAEDIGIGTEVQHLQAVDLDSGINAEIRYRIQHGSYDDFRIDENVGVVSVARKLDFDRRSKYEIEVIAIDLGVPRLSGTATLIIHISNSNDKDPYFTPSTQRAEVREDAPIGLIVYNLKAVDPDVDASDDLEYAASEPIVAIDRDGNEVEHFEDLRTYFSVNRDGAVILNKKLNRNLFSVLRITVLVTDSTAATIQQGRGMLIISVIAVNEFPPEFLPPWSPTNPVIKIQLLEEQPVGTIITTLQAFDRDSTIAEYKIEENSYLQINNTNGMIKTISRLDYETIKEINVIVSVTDAGIPQLTSTGELVVNIVNINDNEPRFDQEVYNFSLLENSPKGTAVGKISATDNDTGIFGEITYSLLGNNSKNFIIDSDTGIIVVSNSSFLDRELVSVVNLNAVAEDKAPVTIRKSAVVNVIINILDINDNPPIFTEQEYFSTVAENAALNPPAALVQIKAEDKDSGLFGEVRYFIKSGNDQNLFLMDPVIGILYPGQSLLGKIGKYNITVEARDGVGAGPFTAVTTVIITIISVNQHRPIFIIPPSTNTTVELPKDILEEGYLVMTLKAEDKDVDDNGKISYHLQIDNNLVQDTKEFIVDKFTGELRTKKELRRNIKSKYDLVLVAKDQGPQTSFETIRFLKILLVNGNEIQPEFSDTLNPYKISVEENNSPNVRIGKIEAFTKKGKGNTNNAVYYYMLLGNEDGAFYIDKVTGEIYTNQSLDRESIDSYSLYILASLNADLHISDVDRAKFSIKKLERDNTVAKVQITVLDVNDNEPMFEKSAYYAGVNAKSAINEYVTFLRATDKDYGKNATVRYTIAATNLYKFGSEISKGYIVPSPFAISKEGRITTNSFVAEYNQDRFELEVTAVELESPERTAKTKVYIWVFESSQLVRVILSRSPAEINEVRDKIIAEFSNTTKSRIIVDEIRYHIDSVGRIRVDWCDLFFHAVDPTNKQIIPVDAVLKVVDSNYDYWRENYPEFAVQNVLPAFMDNMQEEFDLALAGLVALIIILFVGVTSFIVLCCCLKHWHLSFPIEAMKSDSLIKKQIIEDLTTTENPLWIEQKLKLYEEQELTMQVFSEPELISTNMEGMPGNVERREYFESIHAEDSTYATIKLRNAHQTDAGDYATLRDNPTQSIYEFTGSTFQAPVREQEESITELI